MTMNFKAGISHYAKIKGCLVWNDGELVFNSAILPFAQFIEKAYEHYQVKYPKFFKMDNLCKLGFLASELILKNADLKNKHVPEKIGVILSNSNSTLDTDYNYVKMLQKGVASPSIFVYSLPNIVIGEICIRNGIKGENTFFISSQYDIPFQVNYVNRLLETNIIDACICGWVELVGEEYECYLYLTEKGVKDDNLIHTPDNVKRIFDI
jgi:hypothetical protein